MRISRGMRIDGRYVIEGRLGVGGMAEVWAVVHERLETRHALKILTTVAGGGRERLLREGRIQARLQHPNLLGVRGVLEVEGRPALLLPLVEGPPLDRLLRHLRGALAAEEGAALFRALVEGMAYAHGQGVVHRDLKPGNVLLDLQGGRLCPRIGDFGLVKLAQPGAEADPELLMTRTGAFLGTPAYAAPEQLRDAAGVDARADVWSLGVLLVELLTGVRPFGGRTVAALVDAHRAGVALEGVAAPLDALAAWMLRADPADRPADAGAVRAWLAENLPPAEPDPLREGGRLWREARSLLASPVAQPRPVEQTWESTLAPAAVLEETATLAPHNLPELREAMVGREALLAELEMLLTAAGGPRLLTLVGPGGVGKTRLADALGWTQREAHVGGVWRVELAEARSVGDICAAVGSALGVPLGEGALTRLTFALRERGPVLLVLHSLEHLTALAEETLGAWLAAVPTLQVVATSRQPLHLPGEHRVPVDVLGPEDAATLFRLRAAAAGALLDAESHQADILALVEQLDGLPLSIELAASRARLLSPRDMLERLTPRLELLSSRSRALPPRQRTLRATLRWSWDLLSPVEAAVLAQCSVFAQAFSLEAAAAVLVLPPEVTGTEDEGLWLEDVLAELVDKSLLQRTTVRGHARLSMLGAVRHFAAEQLEDPEPVFARHAAWFARHGAPEALAGLSARGGVERWQAMAEDARDILAAAERAPHALALPLGRAAAELYARLGPAQEGAALLARLPIQDSELIWRRGHLLQQAGRLDEARAALDAALALAATDAARAAVQLRLAGLHLIRSEVDAAAALYGEALVHASPREATLIHLNLALIARRRAQPEEARGHYTVALETARRLGDRRSEGTALLGLGNLAVEQGEPAAARRRYPAALDAYRAVGELHGEATLLGNLGILALDEGLLDEARAHFRRALQLHRAMGHPQGIGSALGNLGKIAQRIGRSGEAEERYRQALQLHREVGFRYGAGHWLQGLAELALEQGDGQEAEALAREAVQIAAGLIRQEGSFRATLARALALRGAHDAAQTEATQAHALLSAGGFRQELAAACAAHAEVAWRAGDLAAAQQHLAAAEDHMAAVGGHPGSEVGGLLIAVRRRLSGGAPPP